MERFCHCRLTDSPQLNCATLDLSSHLLNITLNVFVSIEALLSPTNDARTQAQLLKMIQATEVCVASMHSGGPSSITTTTISDRNSTLSENKP
jgi:hypothetical protein